jgi:hypothetical protein
MSKIAPKLLDGAGLGVVMGRLLDSHDGLANSKHAAHFSLWFWFACGQTDAFLSALAWNFPI